MKKKRTKPEATVSTPVAGPTQQPYLQRMDLALERLFVLSRELLGIAGFDGYFKQINPSWQRTLGWSDAEVLGQPYLDLVHPDDRGLTATEAEGLAQGSPRFSSKTGTGAPTGPIGGFRGPRHRLRMRD